MNCTRLIQYKTDLYKIRTETKEEPVTQVSEHTVDHEVDQVIKALVASTQSNNSNNGALNDLQTDHFYVKVTSTLWKAANKLKFKQRNTELKPHNYMYVLTFSVKKIESGADSEGSHSTGELTEEEIEQRRHAKRKLFSPMSQRENTVEEGQGDGKCKGLQAGTSDFRYRETGRPSVNDNVAFTNVTNCTEPNRNPKEHQVMKPIGNACLETTSQGKGVSSSYRNDGHFGIYKCNENHSYENPIKYPHMDIPLVPAVAGGDQNKNSSHGKPHHRSNKFESGKRGSQFTPPISRKRKISSSMHSRGHQNSRSRSSQYTQPLARVMQHRDRHIIEQEQLEEDLKLQQMASTGTCLEEPAKKSTPKKSRRSVIQIIGDLFMTPVRKVTKRY